MSTQPRTGRRGARRERRRRTRRRILIGAVVLVALAAVVVAGAFFLGGDDETPSATVDVTNPTTPPTSTPGSTSGGTTATTKAAEAAKPAGPCAAKGMSAALAASAPSGTFTKRVVGLTNTGNRACTLEGSPGLAFVWAEGEEVAPVQVAVGGGAVPQGLPGALVTVDPGATASFVMSWDFNTTGCGVARSVDITLPGDSATVPLASSGTVCGGTVYVSTFQPGLVTA